MKADGVPLSPRDAEVIEDGQAAGFVMIFSALIGWLVLAERPGLASLLGGLLIAVAGWLVARERRAPKAALAD